MIFKSEFSLQYKVLIGISLFLLIAVSFLPILTESSSIGYFFLLLNLALSGFIIWCILATNYTISYNELCLKSGPIRFRIKVESIVSVEEHNGIIIPAIWKLGLSQNGIIITYNKHKDVYISPKNKNQFIAELKKVNPNISLKTSIKLRQDKE